MTDTHEKFTPSSGCVFADLGVERPAYLEQAQKLADDYSGQDKTLVHQAALALSQAHQDGIREGKRQAAEIALARLPLYTTIDQHNAIRECVSSIVSSAEDEAR